MGIFHSGIYIGYGTSFTLGNHVTAANLFDQVSKSKLSTLSVVFTDENVTVGGAILPRGNPENKKLLCT